MEDGKPNEIDTSGKEDNTDIPKDKGDSSSVETVTKNLEKLKEATDKMEEELLRTEELRAKVAIGGKSDAGGENKPKEETPLEYRDRIDKEITEGKHDD